MTHTFCLAEPITVDWEGWGSLRMNVEVGFRVVTKCLGYVTYILLEALGNVGTTIQMHWDNFGGPEASTQFKSRDSTSPGLKNHV